MGLIIKKYGYIQSKFLNGKLLIQKKSTRKQLPHVVNKRKNVSSIKQIQKESKIKNKKINVMKKLLFIIVLFSPLITQANICDFETSCTNNTGSDLLIEAIFRSQSGTAGSNAYLDCNDGARSLSTGIINSTGDSGAQYSHVLTFLVPSGNDFYCFENEGGGGTVYEDVWAEFQLNQLSTSTSNVSDNNLNFGLAILVTIASAILIAIILNFFRSE